MVGPFVAGVTRTVVRGRPDGSGRVVPQARSSRPSWGGGEPNITGTGSDRAGCSVPGCADIVPDHCNRCADVLTWWS